ncbi:MAG: beta-propeller fold lactonase family protein [Gammaproteobacteria bacterium]
MQRRRFNVLLTGAAAAAALSRPRRIAAQPAASARADIYANVGPRLMRYRIADDVRSLEEVGDPVVVPEEVQEACQWGRYFYVASSDEHTTASPQNHYMNAFEVDASGALVPIGEAVRLRHRPIHITVDNQGRHLLAAFNNPSSIAVHRLGADGSIGGEVRQRSPLDAGVYAHQIRVMPSGRAVILPARGNEPVPGGREEDRGALKIFDYDNGQLTNRQSVAPNGGREFRCRHVEFHPSGKWAYVVIESQNELHTFSIEDDRLSAEPVFVTSVLSSSTRSRPGQAASAIRMHPTNGRTLYVANRGRGTEMFQGEEVISENVENSIAVFSVDSETGEPQLIQSADPQSVDIRMFALHPDGRSLVATSHEMDVPMKQRKGNSIEVVPPRIVLMSIEPDGSLTLQYRQDVRTDGMFQLWCGAVRY